MTTQDYLNQLESDRSDMVDNLETKGITGLTGDETFTELVPEILNITGGSTDIYKVASIAERDSLTGIKENDMCVVGGLTTANWQQFTNSSNITFPETVILPSVCWYYSGTLAADQSSGVYFSGQINIDQQQFRIQGYGDSVSIDVRYSSNDGLTYTRQTIEAEDTLTGDSLVNGDTINLPFSVYINGNWTYEVGYFMQTYSETFNGIFTYKNNSWGYSYVGVDTNAGDIFKNKKSYTNSGFVTGTLGTTIDDTLLKTNYNDICNLVNNYKPVTSSGLFYNYSGTGLAVTKLIDTSLVTDFSSMFRSCANLTSLDVSRFDTSSAQNMSMMFQGCKNLTSLDVSNFNTSNVTNMSRMFQFCEKLTSLDLSGFDTSSVTDVRWMFTDAKALNFLDLRTFSFTTITNNNGIFGDTVGTMKIPKNCLIIVADQTQKTWLLSAYNTLTNVKTVAEYEASLNS